jgi:hypothetical protein
MRKRANRWDDEPVGMTLLEDSKTAISTILMLGQSFHHMNRERSKSRGSMPVEGSMPTKQNPAA